MTLESVSDEDLVEALYAGAASPGALRDGLARAIAHANAGGGNIHVVDKATLESVLFLPSGPSYTPGAIDAYFNHWRHINVHRAAMRRAGGVFLCHEHLSDETLSHAAYARDFYFAMGERWLAGAVAASDPDYEVSLVFNRRGDMPAFDDNTRRLIANLLPHVRRAASLAVSSGFRQALAGGVSAALSASQQPVWLVDASLKIYWANPAASAYVARGGALLGEQQGRLRFSVEGRTAALEALARSVCARRLESASAQSLRVRAGDAAVELEMLPATVPAGAVRGAAALAMVIARPVGLNPRTADLLREAFALSRVEASLAAAVAAGVDLALIAKRRGVSIETVRTQMRAIYAKTETTRQAELAALVWRLGG